ncbi:hypothetical protein [Aneurinibacillus aneurinilyticus]|uniref:hypothetical protein n=1 Tax=Aneurinibacillus aneurinilyticus TaxID=1391 RepID=UPI0023F2CBED|nr:hypothetical protein [Aneurinibacillus aneurinilyticus]
MKNEKMYLAYKEISGKAQYVYAVKALKTTYHLTEDKGQATPFGHAECVKIMRRDPRIEFLEYQQSPDEIIREKGDTVEVTDTSHDTNNRRLSGRSAEILRIRPGSYRLRFDDGFETWIPMEDCS